MVQHRFLVVTCVSTGSKCVAAWAWNPNLISGGRSGASTKATGTMGRWFQQIGILIILNLELGPCWEKFGTWALTEKGTRSSSESKYCLESSKIAAWKGWQAELSGFIQDRLKEAFCFRWASDPLVVHSILESAKILLCPAQPSEGNHPSKPALICVAPMRRVTLHRCRHLCLRQGERGFRWYARQALERFRRRNKLDGWAAL